MYCWHLFKPHTITVPELQSSLPVYPFTAKHIEIVQNNRNHYDSVVAMFPGAQALQPPRINTCVENNTDKVLIVCQSYCAYSSSFL